MQTFPARLGALVKFQLVQGAADIVAGTFLGEILFNLQGKVQIAPLFREAKEYGECMDGRQIGLRGFHGQEAFSSGFRVVIFFQEQTGDFFHSLHVSLFPGLLVPQQQAVHNVVMAPGIPCALHLIRLLGKGARKPALPAERPKIPVLCLAVQKFFQKSPDIGVEFFIQREAVNIIGSRDIFPGKFAQPPQHQPVRQKVALSKHGQNAGIGLI